MPTMLTLPRDLQDYIFRYCSYDDHVSVMFVNVYFHEQVKNRGKYLTKHMHLGFEQFGFDAREFCVALIESNGLIAGYDTSIVIKQQKYCITMLTPNIGPLDRFLLGNGYARDKSSEVTRYSRNDFPYGSRTIYVVGCSAEFAQETIDSGISMFDGRRIRVDVRDLLKPFG
jgi:hypothetical protein